MAQGGSRKKKRYLHLELFTYILFIIIGGGRKIRDPEMEIKLFDWYTNLKTQNVPVTPKMIKQKALDMTKLENFIASTGWLEKYKKKFKLELSRENRNGTICQNTQEVVDL